MDENKDRSSEKYSSQFDDLLSRNQTISKEEREFIDRQKEAKKIANEEASRLAQEAREKQNQRTEQKFDDLLKGKTSSEESYDDKNLQEIFSMFYNKARNADIKKPLGDTVNSARNSIGSMGSKLEARRQQFKDKMQTSVKKGIDGDSEEVAKESQKQTSEHVDKMDAKTTAEESVDAAKAQETPVSEENVKEETVTEEPVATPKVSLKDRLLTKCSSYNQNLSQKYPSLHKKASSTFDYCSEVWAETFPQNKQIARKKLSDRKERARIAKEIEKKMEELTPEELEAYMETIPEWKRGALVVQDNRDNVEEEEYQSVFKRARTKIASKVKNSSFAKDFYEKEGERIEAVRKEYRDFKDSAREQIDASHQPLVRGTAMAYDKIRSDTSQAKAVSAMKRYDPEFDFLSMHYEVEEVFREFYCNYLDGNKEYVKYLTTGEATIMQALIELREKEKWTYKYPEVLDCSEPQFTGAKMIEGVPAFTFTCEVQEFDAKVHVETGEPYYYVPATPESEAQEASEAQEEDPENNSKSEKAKAAYQKLKSRFATNPSEAAKKPRVIKSTYSMTLVRHEEPDIELAGHYWQFIEFQKIDELKQIA